MQKMLRLVAAAAFAFVAGTASAAMDPAKVAAAKKAGDEFIALAAGSDKSGQVPRQADPKAALTPTARTKPSAVCAAMIGHSRGRRCSR